MSNFPELPDVPLFTLSPESLSPIDEPFSHAPENSKYILGSSAMSDPNAQTAGGRSDCQVYISLESGKRGQWTAQPRAFIPSGNALREGLRFSLLSEMFGAVFSETGELGEANISDTVPTETWPISAALKLSQCTSANLAIALAEGSRKVFGDCFLAGAIGDEQDPEYPSGILDLSDADQDILITAAKSILALYRSTMVKLRAHCDESAAADVADILSIGRHTGSDEEGVLLRAVAYFRQQRAHAERCAIVSNHDRLKVWTDLPLDEEASRAAETYTQGVVTLNEAIGTFMNGGGRFTQTVREKFDAIDDPHVKFGIQFIPNQPSEEGQD